MTTEQKKFQGKHLLTQWQEIVSDSNLSDNPSLAAMLHAMFMTGAGASMIALTSADDESAPRVAGEICEELNDWAKTMNLAIMPTIGARQ